MTLTGIIAGILAGGLVTALIAYLFPKNRLARLGSAVVGVVVAYLIMTLVH